MKIAVVSCQFGNFDTPKQFPKQDIDCDYFAINESNCPYTFHTIDNRLKAKYYKMLAHREYSHDVLIWVDGNVQIKSASFVSDMIAAMHGVDVCISNHPDRNNVHDETDFICRQIRSGNKYLSARYTPESLLNEVSRMPKDLLGLYWCGLFARVNEPGVNKVFEEWFMQNVLWSNFDQCNFVDGMYRHGVTINTIKWGGFYDNDTYSIHKHNYIG